MLQILIWAVAFVILALGYIAKLVYVLTLPVEKRTKNSGTGPFVVFLILASLIITLSLTQGELIQGILNQ